LGKGQIQNKGQLPATGNQRPADGRQQSSVISDQLSEKRGEAFLFSGFCVCG